MTDHKYYDPIQKNVIEIPVLSNTQSIWVLGLDNS